ncbi:nucleoporin-domain-containing protein [Mytilinidion resinicola]|uniref:Nucleoporin-domain-containing protein n=1 Tax=Mytilinidion resinicola TaxID=574789 RepID=A0A6A6Y9K2_9PEZI|nr:nucleoporin-domain-containing protein [Mytilinidion resinicola]KAF2805502.1 nucleoporin-domain-containing protein [Mytilinidion resinicola]
MNFPATPQRPTPGSFINTPAAQRHPGFRATSANAPQPPQTQASAQSTVAATEQPPASTKSPLERARKAINETLIGEASYAELDAYVGQGISSDYDIPEDTAWAPFIPVRTYRIPEEILEQYNFHQMNTKSGLFAEINHAWTFVDNQLYLWDYTNPNPEIIGYEEQPHSIVAVKLVKPRAKVFVDTITHLLVVATTSDIHLIGVSTQRGQEGVENVSLYQTGMHTSVRSLKVGCIEGSPKTGRIFFADGRDSDDVYELTYQQEEKWFANRCAKVNHVRKSIALPGLPFGSKKTAEFIVQMVIDDTRGLLYTLSSGSTIKVYHLKTDTTLDLAITRSLASIMQNCSHMVRSELLGPSATIVSIDAISSMESARLSLMATTSTGCRIFLSSTSGTYYFGDSSSAPTSMQVQHIKFPPPQDPQPNQTPQSQMTPYKAQAQVAIGSRVLEGTIQSNRYAPGYFLCFASEGDVSDYLFMSGPDSGRIARPQDLSQAPKFIEMGYSLSLGAKVQDVGLATPPFAAASAPRGFGNELATQFDQPVAEFAILTNYGVQTIRRRRLVDIFASAVKQKGANGSDGLEAEIKKFVRLYGRAETIATALAVVCGQGQDIASDSRVVNVTDQDVLEYARTAFVDYGGKAQMVDSTFDVGSTNDDNVRPSPRHDGIALYISRLVRSIWASRVLKEGSTPIGGLKIDPTISLEKLRTVQRHLTHLQEFLDKNKSFIDGLNGPDALNRAPTQQAEKELQGENAALTSLVQLLRSVIEGISFVQVLFDERVDEIILSLNDTSRQRARELTFVGLFTDPDGKELAKELVKAIVNRNIAKGSNVETISEALRRRCGSFCSAEDVVIFKAQEQVTKASEAGANSELGRTYLNDSLRLFESVAGSLSREYLEVTIVQYTNMAFYAGAIRLALKVAQESDRGNRALAWIREGRLSPDARQAVYESRTRSYDLIHQVIQAVDQASNDQPAVIDGVVSAAARRRNEAYDQINSSEDEVFQTNLYDWYLQQGWSDRLLEISSPHVVTYLKEKSREAPEYGDLLWRYYAHYNNYFDAAIVQLQLAKSFFTIKLSQRIEYLSRARANASTRVGGISEMRSTKQQTRQDLLREVSDLLDIATIQEDILDKLKSDPRTAGRRDEILSQLDGNILPVTDLYNGFADQAGYYDMCILIYQAADYRNAADIESTWQNLIEQTASTAETESQGNPWQQVANVIRTIGRRVRNSETIFNVPMLLQLLLKWDAKHGHVIPEGARPDDDRYWSSWVLDIFLELRVPCESLLATLETLFYENRAPLAGRDRRHVTKWMIYTMEKWWQESQSLSAIPFGSEDNAIGVEELLKELIRQWNLDDGGVWQERARDLRDRVAAALR